jgi:hypothetical protein
MIPTVALLHVEVKGTAQYVARRSLVARVRQLALAIARSKLKGDARLDGVAPRGASCKSISYVIDAELVAVGASPRRDHVVVGRHNGTRASNEKPPISWRPGCGREEACVKCIARGREKAIGGGARLRFELEGDAPVPGDGCTSCGTLRQRIAGRGTMLIGTSAPGPSRPPNVGGARARQHCERCEEHEGAMQEGERPWTHRLPAKG